MSNEAVFRELAREMIAAGVSVADPRQSIKDSVKVDGDTLTVRGDTFSLNDYDRVFLFGVGKASTPMCQAFEDILKPDNGLVITKIGEEICIADVKVRSGQASLSSRTSRRKRPILQRNSGYD